MFEDDEPNVASSDSSEVNETQDHSSSTGLWLAIIGVVVGYLLAVAVFIVAGGLFEILGDFGVSVPGWLVPYITGVFVLIPTLGFVGVLTGRNRPAVGATIIIAAGVLESLAGFPVGLIPGGFLVSGGIALWSNRPRGDKFG